MVHGLLEAQPVAASPTGVFEQAALQADALIAGDGVLAAGGTCHVVTGSHICRNYAADGAAAVAH